MLHRIQDDERFLDSIIFSDESMFHVSNCWIWGSENPGVFLEYVCARQPRGEHVLCPQQRKVYGPFFFMETTITSIVYLDMLQQFLIPQTKMTKKDAFTSSTPSLP
jgi:hypothetical protein